MFHTVPNCTEMVHHPSGVDVCHRHVLAYFLKSVSSVVGWSRALDMRSLCHTTCQLVSRGVYSKEYTLDLGFLQQDAQTYELD
jgi:hypothetical protein